MFKKVIVVEIYFSFIANNVTIKSHCKAPVNNRLPII